MASTPSASALSAVLRCQGNILARKQANQTRPAASVYGLGIRSSSHRSCFRALLGYLFHRDNVEIPSVSTPFKTSLSMQSAGRDAPISKKCRKVKLNRNCYIVAFKSERHDLLSQSSLVLLRLNDGHLWKIISGSFCICVICAQSMLKQNEMDSLCPIGLLSFWKNRLVCLTDAVSDIVRTKLGIDWTNQIHPHCDKLSGCVKYTTEDHKEALSETRQGEASEPEE